MFKYVVMLLIYSLYTWDITQMINDSASTFRLHLFKRKGRDMIRPQQALQLPDIYRKLLICKDIFYFTCD